MCAGSRSSAPCSATRRTPTELALSDNGRVLHVFLSGTQSVRRIDLPTLTAGQPFNIGAHASEMVVLRGTENSLAVSLAGPYSPSHLGVAVWDNGVRRPVVSPGHIGSDVIAAGDSAGVLYGLDLCCSGNRFFVLGVRPDRVRINRETSGLLRGPGLIVANGRLHDSAGGVADVARLQRVGAFDGGGIAPTPEPAAGRAYALREISNMYTEYELVVFDLSTTRTMSVLSIGSISGSDHDGWYAGGTTGLQRRPATRSCCSDPRCSGACSSRPSSRRCLGTDGSTGPRYPGPGEDARARALTSSRVSRSG